MTASKQEQLILSQATLNSHFAETYRTLRANINFSGIDQPLKVMLVTSAAPREGKTTTVLNLGIIMAQAGPRVLIVDADLRHPMLHKALGMSSNGHAPAAGLTTAIVGKSTLDEAIVPTAFSNLFLLPAGITPPNPSELLGSQRMQALMHQVLSDYDVVLLDSPPCLLYADAYVLSRIASGVLYVLRAGAQDKAAQRRVHKQLQQAKARLLGVVFNDVEMEDGASGYAYYYPYGRKHRK